jgi:hypothetical protein
MIAAGEQLRRKTMRRASTIAVLLGLLVCPVSAQEPARGAGVATEADVRRLLELTGQASVARQVMESVLGSIKRAYPAVPEAVWTEFLAEMREDELTSLVVPIYRKHLTADDIRGLLAFYESPVGRKLVQVQPLLVNDSMTAGRQWGEQTAGRIIRRLQEKGYSSKTPVQ